jgi:hypothetical protein
MQTPQELDATHSDELFPVKREFAELRVKALGLTVGDEAVDGVTANTPHARPLSEFHFGI